MKQVIEAWDEAPTSLLVVAGGKGDLDRDFCASWGVFITSCGGATGGGDGDSAFFPLPLPPPPWRISFACVSWPFSSTYTCKLRDRFEYAH